MKNLLSKSLLGVALVGLLLAPSAYAKKKHFDLTAFRGTYTGSVTLVDPMNTTSSGAASVVISVPKQGRTATIDYTAVLSLVQQTVLTLAADKTLTVTDLGVGIAGANNAHRGTGSYSQSKRRLAFTATNGDTTLTGFATVQDKKRKRLLNLVLVSADAGGSYTYSATLQARLRKPAH